MRNAVWALVNFAWVTWWAYAAAVLIAGCGANRAEVERAAAYEKRALDHNLQLAACRDWALALDAGPKQKYYEYAVCADMVDRSYGIEVAR